MDVVSLFIRIVSRVSNTHMFAISTAAAAAKPLFEFGCVQAIVYRLKIDFSCRYFAGHCSMCTYCVAQLTAI